jgi:hypothetical protein
MKLSCPAPRSRETRQKHTIQIKDWLGAVANWWEEVTLQLVGDVPAHSYTKTLTFNGCELIPVSVVDNMFEYLEKAEKWHTVVVHDIRFGRWLCKYHRCSCHGVRASLPCTTCRVMWSIRWTICVKYEQGVPEWAQRCHCAGNARSRRENGLWGLSLIRGSGVGPPTEGLLEIQSADAGAGQIEV